ncbi:MAG: HIT family protein [Erysipelotrichaceae bacterium]|nr:HIT family protein [Erysipelotrichaceae bacterium]
MCIFCDIVNGTIPSYKVYEDDKFLAILDIAQTTKGHTLVMPKEHYDNVIDMPTEVVKELMGVTQIVARKILKNLNAKGNNLLVNTDRVAGQMIDHTHFHIIPRYSELDTVNISFTENKLDLAEVLAEINK